MRTNESLDEQKLSEKHRSEPCERKNLYREIRLQSFR